MDFLKDIAKQAGNEYASLVADGVEAGDVDSFIDSGSYIFNALLSGSIHGGLPSNKITAIAGESSTGKTFFSLAVVRNFLDSNPDAAVLYFDTESAITKSLLQDRCIDTNRVVVLNVVTIEEFRTKALQCVSKYMERDEADRQPMMFVLDSLGMLLTPTDVDQFQKGDMKGDMGRKPKALAALVRNTVNQIAPFPIALVATNHTYASQDMFDPDDKISGGQGFIYASSIVVAIKKLKLKEDADGKKVSSVQGIRAACKV